MEAENEDGTFLVIIGDKVSEAKPDPIRSEPEDKIPVPFLIKHEYSDEIDGNLVISDLIATIKKHGVHITRKIEPQQNKDEEIDWQNLLEGIHLKKPEELKYNAELSTEMEAANPDALYLVIIGDNDSDTNPDMLATIKQEYVDESDGSLAIADLGEMIRKHGVHVDTKIEPQDIKEDQIEFLEDISTDNYYSKDSAGNDVDYIPDDEYDVSDNEHNMSLEEENINKKSKKHGTKRCTMLKPWQQRSLVQELRQEYEELRDDRDLLIDTLTAIMRNVKPPELPNEYCVMKNMRFSCIKCGATTESLPAAGRHYQEKHGQRYLVCYACGVDFRSTTNLYKHEKRCVAPDASVVLIARAAFLGRKGRGRPYLSLRPPLPKVTRFPCDECSAVFNRRVTLEAHRHLHRGERPHRCHACPAAYTSHSALARHTKTHTDAQFICDHCGKSFKIKVALASHMDTHRPLRKHECVECGRRFSQKCAMLLHVSRVHRQLPPPCACQICPKRYQRMSLLKTHMKREHNIILMTRKMFFKTLPNLTEAQVQQAKVVLASEAPSLENILKWDGYDNERRRRSNKDLHENEYQVPSNAKGEESYDGETYSGEFEGHNGEEFESRNGEEFGTHNGDGNSEESQDIDSKVRDLIQLLGDENHAMHETYTVVVQNGEIMTASKEHNKEYYKLVECIDSVDDSVKVKEESELSEELG